MYIRTRIAATYKAIAVKTIAFFIPYLSMIYPIIVEPSISPAPRAIIAKRDISNCLLSDQLWDPIVEVINVTKLAAKVAKLRAYHIYKGITFLILLDTKSLNTSTKSFLKVESAGCSLF